MSYDMNDLLELVVDQKSSDLHLQVGVPPCLRLRGSMTPIDGPELRPEDTEQLMLSITPDNHIQNVKLNGGTDFGFAFGEKARFRVSVMKAKGNYGLVLRQIPNQLFDLRTIGMPDKIKELLYRPRGLFLVTGPTGSGKSTSLNAFLRKINSSDLRIVTIEDPIEYEVPGANQMQTHAEIGLTFASALRHVLRQDPDVIMVGEIRDLDTAEIAIRASLTGHLVFSTLHTNDAPGAITRLTDMGVEPFLVASAVELVIAQRLVRRLCPDCAKKKPVDPVSLHATLEALQLSPAEADSVTELHEPVGCRACRQTGFRGRIGLFEILHPKPLHDLIVRRESSKALATLARSQGMRTLQQSGWDRVKSGHTSLQELLRTISTSGE